MPVYNKTAAEIQGLDRRLDDPAEYHAWLDGAPGFPPDRYEDGPPVNDTFEPTREDAAAAAALLASPYLADHELARIDANIAERARLADEYEADYGHLRRSMLARDVAEFLARTRGGQDD